MIVLDDPRMMEAAHAAILAEINQLEDRRRLRDLLRRLHRRGARCFAEEGFRLDEREMKRSSTRRRKRARPEWRTLELLPTRVTLGPGGEFLSLRGPDRRGLGPGACRAAGPGARAAGERPPRRRGRSRPAAHQGQFLQRLLVPEDLLPWLDSPAPLVMMLDRETAKIHWEMVAQPEPVAFRGHRRSCPWTPGDDPCPEQVRVLRPLPGHQPGLHAAAPHHLRAAARAPAARRGGCSASWSSPTRPRTPRSPAPSARGTRSLTLFEAFNAVYEDAVREPDRGRPADRPRAGHPHRGARAPDAPPLRRAPLRRATASTTRTTPRSRAGSSPATSGSRPTS